MDGCWECIEEKKRIYIEATIFRSEDSNEWRVLVKVQF